MEKEKDGGYSFSTVSFLSDEVVIVKCVIKCIMVHLQRITCLVNTATAWCTGGAI